MASVDNPRAHTHASALAPARGSLQIELDAEIERNTRFMDCASAEGFPINVVQRDGRRFWFVPAPFVARVGFMCAVVN